MATQGNSSRRILHSDPKVVDVGDVIRRRQGATVAILKCFEELIEPLISPGNQAAIQMFKGVCRKKINGVAYVGIRAARALPGDSVSATTADLAEDLAFDDTEE